MENKELLLSALEGTLWIALATSVDGQPNVRLLNVHWDSNRPGVILFPSEKDRKEKSDTEYGNKVAFAGIPSGPGPFVKGVGVVRRSEVNFEDIKDGLAFRAPHFMSDESPGFDLYEIVIEKTTLILGPNRSADATPA
ncbi:MAG: hypothetical protein LBT41_00475 [Candidatus Methanoplasma sp.]|jgi:hypothetical protein|nr:hypothetical protein [Candidatus Methanoplasma sp.]